MRKKISVFTLIVTFTCASLSVPTAQAQQLVLPAPGTRIALSPEFTPAHLQGITIHPENALKFDFIVHKGDSNLSDQEKQEEYKKLIKYFLASLAVPDENQWVNLSPYEKDRIIKDDFGKTEMGRDLLSQDYLLKQITASLIYPEEGLGQKFWNRVYEEAAKKFGTTNIPVNTFNKVWIVPDNAVIYEKGNTAYVLKNHLKVMLEEDYLAVEKNRSQSGDMLRKPEGIATCPQAGCQANKAVNVKANELGSQIIREIVLPALEKEVNEGKNFAQLRQVYSGMILAAWYKRALKESLLSKIYADKGKLRGLSSPNTLHLSPPNASVGGPEHKASSTGFPTETFGNDTEYIYQQYLQAFKKGVYNYIKEEQDPTTQQMIPRKYFSGGTENSYRRILKHTNTIDSDQAMSIEEDAVKLDSTEVLLKESDKSMTSQSLDDIDQKIIDQIQITKVKWHSAWVEALNITLPQLLNDNVSIRFSNKTALQSLTSNQGAFKYVIRKDAIEELDSRLMQQMLDQFDALDLTAWRVEIGAPGNVHHAYYLILGHTLPPIIIKADAAMRVDAVQTVERAIRIQKNVSGLESMSFQVPKNPFDISWGTIDVSSEQVISVVERMRDEIKTDRASDYSTVLRNTFSVKAISFGTYEHQDLTIAKWIVSLLGEYDSSEVVVYENDNTASVTHEYKGILKFRPSNQGFRVEDSMSEETIDGILKEQKEDLSRLLSAIEEQEAKTDAAFIREIRAKMAILFSDTISSTDLQLLIDDLMSSLNELKKKVPSDSAMAGRIKELQKALLEKDHSAILAGIKAFDAQLNSDFLDAAMTTTIADVEGAYRDYAKDLGLFSNPYTYPQADLIRQKATKVNSLLDSLSDVDSARLPDGIRRIDMERLDRRIIEWEARGPENLDDILEANRTDAAMTGRAPIASFRTLPESHRTPETNQDAGFADPERSLISIADGVSGSVDGRFAAQTSVNAISQEVTAEKLRLATTPQDVIQLIVNGLERTVRDIGAHPLKSAASTTSLSAAVWQDPKTRELYLIRVSKGDGWLLLRHANGEVEFEFLNDELEDNMPRQLSGAKSSAEGYKYSFRKVYSGDRFFLMTDGFKLPFEAMGRGNDGATEWFTTLLSSEKNIGDNIDALMQSAVRSAWEQQLGDDLTIAGVEVPKSDEAMAVVNFPKPPLQDSAWEKRFNKFIATPAGIITLSFVAVATFWPLDIALMNRYVPGGRSYQHHQLEAAAGISKYEHVEYVMARGKLNTIAAIAELTGYPDAVKLASMNQRTPTEVLPDGTEVMVPGRRNVTAVIRKAGLTPEKISIDIFKDSRYAESFHVMRMLSNSAWAGPRYAAIDAAPDESLQEGDRVSAWIADGDYDDWRNGISESLWSAPHIGENAPLANPGGIDMNAANLNLQIKRDGKGIPLPIAQQNLENIRIDGLVPIILEIKPALATPLLSELQVSGVQQQAKI